jgi:hypothetical protein
VNTIIAEPVATACACDGQVLCLFHYGELPPVRRARERQRAGIQEPHLGRGR